MSVQSGNGGDEVGGNGMVKVGDVKHVDFLKEMLQVVEWINKGSEDGIKKDDDSSSPLAIKLEERFNVANARIRELEGKLVEAQEENGVLIEKLNDMELLAGHHQSELNRMNQELEMEKWERFDAEARLKKMVKEVAELHATLGEMVTKLKEVEESSDFPDGPLVKKEIPDQLEGEQDFLGQDEDYQREEFRYMFVELSSSVQERLQKCEGMQTETKAELAGIFKGLSNLEQMISKGKTVPQQPTTVTTKSSPSSFIPSQSRVTMPPPLPPPPAVEPKGPVPIKSILMKRSADGTFVIRRDSQDQPHQQSDGNPKRKRVQFCFDDSKSVKVHAESKENQKQTPSETVQRLPDPMEVDNVDFQQFPEADHFQILDNHEHSFHCNCGRIYASKKLLSRHISAKMNGKIFNCPICSKNFVLHESLKKHVEKTHKVQYHGGRYGCRECGETFSLYRELRHHRSIHRQNPIS